MASPEVEHHATMTSLQAPKNHSNGASPPCSSDTRDSYTSGECSRSPTTSPTRSPTVMQNQHDKNSTTLSIRQALKGGDFGTKREMSHDATAAPSVCKTGSVHSKTSALESRSTTGDFPIQASSTDNSVREWNADDDNRPSIVTSSVVATTPHTPPMNSDGQYLMTNHSAASCFTVERATFDYSISTVFEELLKPVPKDHYNFSDFATNSTTSFPSGQYHHGHLPSQTGSTSLTSGLTRSTSGLRCPALASSASRVDIPLAPATVQIEVETLVSNITRMFLESGTFPPNFFEILPQREAKYMVRVQ